MMGPKIRKQDVVLMLLGIVLILASCWIFSGLWGLRTAGDIQGALFALLALMFIGGIGGCYLLLEKWLVRYEFLLMDMAVIIVLSMLAVCCDMPSCVVRLMDGAMMLSSGCFQNGDGWRGQIARFLSALNVSCNVLIVALFGLVVWQFVKRCVMRRCRNVCDNAVKRISEYGKSFSVSVLKAQKKENS